MEDTRDCFNDCTDVLVHFIIGRVLQKDASNVIFNRLNCPVPRQGDKFQFPKRYWDRTGVNQYRVYEVCWQYQDFDGATFVWVFLE